MSSEDLAGTTDPSDYFLDHTRSSDWLGELAAATHTASSRNPACGDEVTLQLHIEQQSVA